MVQDLKTIETKSLSTWKSLNPVGKGLLYQDLYLSTQYFRRKAKDFRYSETVFCLITPIGTNQCSWRAHWTTIQGSLNRGYMEGITLCMFLFCEWKQDFWSRAKIFFRYLVHLPTFTLPPLAENQPLSIQTKCYSKSQYYSLSLLFRVIGYNSIAKLKYAAHAALSVTPLG